MSQGFAVPLPQRLFDANGLPAVGWKVYTWTPTGTFVTPLTTYSDSGLTTPNTNPIVTDGDGYFRAFVGTDVVLDVQVKDDADVPKFTWLSIEPMPATTAANPVITGDGGSGVIFSKTVLFTENATSTVHTGTVAIPAGATLLDIIVVPQVLWTATGTVNFTCGDANSANGWFTNTNLKATDLILGERLQASNPNNWGGVMGTYLTTAGRFGQQSANMIGGYCPTAYSVIGVVTVGTPATTAGRTRMQVLWTVGQSVTPVIN
jgi:hypothetical protein